MKIKEVELIHDVGQSEREKHASVKKGGTSADTIKKAISSGQLVKVTKTKGHTIYYKKYNGENDDNTRFYAVNDNTGLVDMTVNGNMTAKGNYNIFDIYNLYKRAGSTIRAYDFYRAILLKMTVIFIATTHTYGGMRTWQELSKFPDITVFGWINGKAVNIDPRDEEETHASHSDVYGSDEIDRDANDIIDMKLVAHRKIRR